MMKNYLIFVSAVFVLTGCSGNGSNKNSTRVVYKDVPSLSDGDLTLSFTNLLARKSYGSETCSVSFTMNLLNSNPKPLEFNISSPKFIRESNGAEYSVSGFITNPITMKLECDIEKTYSFSTTLPTGIGDDKYYFSFRGNSVNYKFCLYDKPDELRKKYTVKYVVDGAQVDAQQVTEGKKLGDYGWTAIDYVYGCNEWYSDSGFTKKIADSSVVTSDTTVYGQRTTILKYITPDAISSAYVSGYNFVPSNGEVVIPRSYVGRSIYGILAGSFSDSVTGMKKIYIPKITTISDLQNFNNCSDLETVYFEGTEAEWNSINKASFKKSVTFVFNTYK